MILKPPSLSETYSHVYSYDQALDPTRDGYDEAYRLFHDTGDPKHLEPFVREGQRYAVWELRPIHGKARRLLSRLVADSFNEDGEITDSRVLWVACALGVVGVQNVFGEDGKPIRLVRHRDEETRLKCLTDAMMDMLEEVDTGRLVNEIGIRVILQMRPGPD